MRGQPRKAASTTDAINAKFQSRGINHCSYDCGGNLPPPATIVQILPFGFRMDNFKEAPAVQLMTVFMLSNRIHQALVNQIRAACKDVHSSICATMCGVQLNVVYAMGWSLGLSLSCQLHFVRGKAAF